MLQPRKPRLSRPFHAFFSPLSFTRPPRSLSLDPLDARSFTTALFAFNVIFTTLVYIPPAAWRSQRTINYRTRTRHYRYTYTPCVSSLSLSIPPSLVLHPRRISISIPESVRAEINYPCIHKDSSLRPSTDEIFTTRQRHDGVARLVSLICPGQIQIAWTFVKKKSGLKLGNWVVYRYYSSVLLG